MPERRRALFVAPEAPYPLVGGGALRAASVLQFLAQSHTVDAIVFHTPGSPVLFPPGLIDRLDTVELPAHSKHYAARALRNGQRMLRRSPPLVDRFAGFGDTIGALLGGRPAYDIAVLEHFWCAPYWEQIAPASAKTVLDLHNIESVLHARCARAEAVFTKPVEWTRVLDYLSRQFMAKNWSVKQIIRTVMLSNTYQQSSDTNPEYAVKDGDNGLLVPEKQPGELSSAINLLLRAPELRVQYGEAGRRPRWTGRARTTWACWPPS